MTKTFLLSTIQEEFNKIVKNNNIEIIQINNFFQNINNNFQLNKEIINKIQETHNKFYFIQDESNIFLIIHDCNNTVLLENNNAYYFNNNFEYLFALKGITNNREDKNIKKDVTPFFSIKSHNFNIITNSASSFKLNNSLIKEFYFYTHQRKQFFFIPKKNQISDCSFEPNLMFPDQINITFNNSFIDKMILDINCNPTHVVFSYNLTKSLDLEKSYYDIKNYDEIIDLIKDKMDIYTLKTDKKIPLISKKKFYNEVNKIKFFIENKTFFLNLKNDVDNCANLNSIIKTPFPDSHSYSYFNNLIEAHQTFYKEDSFDNIALNFLKIILLHNDNTLNLLNNDLISKIVYNSNYLDNANLTFEHFKKIKKQL